MKKVKVIVLCLIVILSVTGCKEMLAFFGLAGDDDSNSSDSPSTPSVPPTTIMEVTISETGGVITIEDSTSPIYGASLLIPDGAIDEAATITIEYLSAPEEGYASPLISFECSATLQDDVYITLPITIDYDLGDMFIAFVKDADGNIDDCSAVFVESSDGLAHFKVGHLSNWFVQKFTDYIENYGDFFSQVTGIVEKITENTDTYLEANNQDLHDSIYNLQSLFWDNMEDITLLHEGLVETCVYDMFDVSSPQEFIDYACVESAEELFLMATASTASIYEAGALATSASAVSAVLDFAALIWDVTCGSSLLATSKFSIPFLSNLALYYVAEGALIILEQYESSDTLPSSLLGTWYGMYYDITLSEDEISVIRDEVITYNIVEINSDELYFIVFIPEGEDSEAGYAKVNWNFRDDELAIQMFLKADTIQEAIVSTEILDYAIISRAPFSIESIYEEYFGLDSYLPLIEGLTWTNNHNETCHIADLDYNNESILIQNDDGSGSSFFQVEYAENGIGYCIYNHGDEGEEYFLPDREYFVFEPLCYSNDALSLGLSWESDGYSNGYEIEQNIEVTSMSKSITTPGGQYYSNCLELTRTIDYIEGYDWDVYITEVKYYLKKGIGYVEAIKEWSDGSTTYDYITDYHY